MHSPAKRHLSSFQIIILGFLAVILIGAVVLSLPISSREGVYTPFKEALFTSTSAVCVTGLVVHDTASYWSLFGQGTILALIQIGGLGVMTVGVFFAVISGRRISLMQRSTMQEAIASHKLGGVIKLTQFAVIVTLIIEAAGAALMAPVFYRDFGSRGIWMAVFHSVSAFCNAGFDIMGGPEGQYVSLMSYAADPLINITVMLLIIVGGLGFLTWDDIYSNRLSIKRYRMQSKVILVTSGILIIIPAIFFYFSEFSHLGGERLLVSLFQSVTTRTAGFNTADLTAMSAAGIAAMIPLMLIGGSPGSTAGGMKTTTIAVIFANAIAVFKRRDDTGFFGRRVENDVVRHACAILTLYLVLFFGSATAINLLEGIPMKECLFEAASAIGTVGLSLGITPSLGTISQIVLIALMFLGRVGGLTLIYAAFSSPDIQYSKLPVGNITVG